MMLDRASQRDVPDAWSAHSTRGMVASAHYRASEAGAEILRAGGNAFDAAIAISLALGVCEPAGSGLGGMGMMLGFDATASRVFGLAAPCRAPFLATPDQLKGLDRYRGYAAAATPALCAMLHHVYTRYASCPREMICAPAVSLAREGFLITPTLAEMLERNRNALGDGHGFSAFYCDGNPASPGHSVTQPELANTLERLAQCGFDDFYTGAIAEQIDAEMTLSDGFVRTADLRTMLDLREVSPLVTSFDDAHAYSLGPPAGGLSLVQLLGIANRLSADELDLDDPDGVVRVARLIRRVRKDRQRYRLRIGAEVSAEAAEVLAAAQLDAAAHAIVDSGTGETSHFCVADAKGNWVSMTQSIERSFGAGVASPALGFLHNGYLRAFKIENTRHPHFLRPAVAARSNAAPVLLVRHGAPIAAIGSTGSERMHSGILEVLLRMRKLPPFEAVCAPRFHATPDGEVRIEMERFSAAALGALSEAGFQIIDEGGFAFSMGGLQLLVRVAGRYTGVGEPRRDGLAVGI